MVTRLALLGLAGGAGTIARYWMHLVVVGRLGHPAFATFVVNTSGCFLLGLFWSMLHRRDMLTGDLRLVLLTGFLGAFTTFSALLFDTAKLARDVSVSTAMMNVAGQFAFGVAAMALGAWLGRLA